MSDMKLNKPLQPRHWMLGGGLALTLAATLWAAQSESADEAAVQPVAGDRRATNPASTPSTRSVGGKASEDVLTVSDWRPVQRQAWAEVTPAQLSVWSPPAVPPPPPPPPPPAQVAAAPVAPPFPYQLMGRMEEGDTVNGKSQAVAFLSGPLRSLGVHTGEVIDGQWRVDQISPTGLSVTWLPAQLKQTIAFRPASS